MPTPNHTVLGIDPGVASTGYGVIKTGPRLPVPTTLEYGVIRTPANTPLAQRLMRIYDQLRSVSKRHQPTLAGCEQLFFARNTTTALAVAHARGVILLLLAQQHTPLVELTPLQVKQSVVGYGRADKSQMQSMVQRLLRLQRRPTPDDAADALAVALAAVTYSTKTT